MYGKQFYKDCISSLVKFLLQNGFTSAPTPPVHLHRNAQDEKNPFKQFTGYFKPDTFEIHLFLNGRHPKDVLRTLAHELVHVKQHNENRLAEGGADLKDDPELRECELEAFTQGNLGFREWTEQMGKDDFGNENVIVNESEIEPGIEFLEKFLRKNRDTIRAGLKYLKGLVRSNLIKTLEQFGFELEVVPDDEWNEYKDDPTEVSEDDRTLRVKWSYYRAQFCNFQDRYGWPFHEMVHAAIFSGNMPSEFMDIDSPFRYPMNTDEIYAFGFQLAHIYGTRKYQRLLDYYAGRPGHEEFPEIFDIFVRIVLKGNK